MQLVASGKAADFDGFIGTSPVMLALYDRIEKAASSSAPVFISGEPGTGKTLCARTIYKLAPAGEIFTSLPCATLTPALLEDTLDGGGVVLLDETGDLDPALQTILLHALAKEKCRLICTTNHPLTEKGAGSMRADLFYRLHVLSLVMPPLRLRGDDIPDMAGIFLLRDAASEKKLFKSLSADAELSLCRYDWPGNIHQLKNIIHQAVIMHDGPVLTAAMLALSDFTAPQADESADNAAILPLPVVARQAMERAIRICGGDITRAAALLQISPSTLYRKKALWDVKTP